MGGKIKAEAGLLPRPFRRRHRAPLLWLVLPFVGGLAASTVCPSWPSRFLTELGLVAALAAVFLGTIKRRWGARGWGLSLVVTMLTVGLLAGYQTRPVLPRRLGQGPPSIWVTVRVEKISPPKPRGPKALTCSGLGRVTATGRGQEMLVDQTIYFSLLLRPGEVPPRRSAEIKLSGSLKPVPAKGGSDSFNGYLRGLGVAAELTPAWLRGETQPPSWFAVRCEALADRMSAILGTGFAERPDLAAIYRAMMLGRKTDLTAAQKELFVASGTMHLFAINGLHIGIVALTLHAAAGLLRCPRPVGSALVLAVLWLDVASTGASPSAVRAFLMAASAEAAHALWLPLNPLATLTTAAAVMLALNPREAFGASFQMSFGVVAGLALLGVPLSEWLQNRYPAYPFLPSRSLNWIQRARAAAQSHLLGAAGFGAAAAAVSAVTGVEYFGTFAPSGLVANLALMPLAMLVIVAGFISIVGGLAHAPLLSALFNSASRLLLQAILAALSGIVQLPGASLQLHYRAGWIGPAALCALLAACFWGYAHDWKKEHGGWWPPFLVAGFALLFGGRID